MNKSKYYSNYYSNNDEWCLRPNRKNLYYLYIRTRGGENSKVANRNRQVIIVDLLHILG